MDHRVRDHIPLEQGLRHSYLIKAIVITTVRDHIPLEQGLRPKCLQCASGSIYVRDHIPLEQGLRLSHKEVIDGLNEKSETIFH